MSITIDPTVPPSTESLGNADVRIQAVASWILQVLGQSGAAAYTMANAPFSVDVNGNVNITQGSGFQIGGSPAAFPTAIHRSTNQSLTGSFASDTVLQITASASDIWIIRYVLFTDALVAGGGNWAIQPSVPSGSTWRMRTDYMGAGQGSINAGSLTLDFNVTNSYVVDLTVAVGPTGGNINMQYKQGSNASNVLALSSVFAYKAS